MSKIRQNIITFFLGAALLLTGNFAYGLTHLDCVVEQSTHHACQQECCATTDCCEEVSAPGFMQSLTISSEKCCEVHIDEARAQDYAVLLISKSLDKAKYGFVKSDIKSHIEVRQAFTILPVQKISSTDIYLSVSNLRI